MNFLARSNQFCLQTNLQKWGKSDWICKFCNLAEPETLTQRLLLCPFFNKDLSQLYRKIDISCHPELSSNILASPVERKLELLLGDDVYTDWGHEQGHILDKLVKQFLIQIFNPL